MKYLFSHPRALAILNSVLIALAVLANSYAQVFCNPVLWAKIVLCVLAVFAVAFPYLIGNIKFTTITGVLSGVLACFCLYCILFLGKMNILGFILPMPYFILAQVIYKAILKPISNQFKLLFFASVTTAFLIALSAGLLYKQEFSNLKEAKAIGYNKLEINYLTERVVGMHFIYHTKFCEFDGWRPPKHDPFLVVGMWLNGMEDPLDIRLEERVALYKKLFPANRVKSDCSCAKMYSSIYHNDPLFQN